jgi:hypothetical protein
MNVKPSMIINKATVYNLLKNWCFERKRIEQFKLLILFNKCLQRIVKIIWG